MDTDFKPTAFGPTPDDYVKDDLTAAYAEAYELGLWIKEWSPNPSGHYMCGVGSYYFLQKIEFENGIDPDGPDAIDPRKFGLGDCVELGLPGAGASREEAIRDGIRAFKDSPLWEQHERWHEEATE